MRVSAHEVGTFGVLAVAGIGHSGTGLLDDGLLLCVLNCFCDLRRLMKLLRDGGVRRVVGY